MTPHPIDTEALGRRAGHVLFTQGPEQPAATARETCVLLDQLAEEKALRMKAVAAATEAEARIEAVQGVLDTWMTYCQTEQTARALGEVRLSLDA